MEKISFDGVWVKVLSIIIRPKSFANRLFQRSHQPEYLKMTLAGFFRRRSIRLCLNGTQLLFCFLLIREQGLVELHL